MQENNNNKWVWEEPLASDLWAIGKSFGEYTPEEEFKAWREAHGRSGGVLILQYESPGAQALDSPDNLTVTPRGGLVLCEDDASGDSDTDPLAPGITEVNRLIGLTPEGGAFVFAVNTWSDTELAGACFSPDGSTLFVNLYGASEGTPAEHADAGMTCAITGPWADGPL